MNWVNLHLMINHVPIILTGLGTISAIVALLTRKRIIWIYALTTLVLAGLSVYPVFFAGSRAEKVVEEHDRTARERIEEHEEAADTALWLILFTGAAATYGLYELRKNREQELRLWLKLVTVALTIGAFTVVMLTALRGGHIRHEPWELGLSRSSDRPAPTVP